MTRSLTILLMLLMIAAWRIGFHVPLPSATAQTPAEPAPAAAEPVTDPDDITAPLANGDPDFAQIGLPLLPGQAQTAEPRHQRPFNQVFQLELTVLAPDGLSFEKIPVSGRARVAPRGLSALPDVSVSLSPAASGMGASGMGMSDMGFDPYAIDAESTRRRAEIMGMGDMGSGFGSFDDSAMGGMDVYGGDDGYGGGGIGAMGGGSGRSRRSWNQEQMSEIQRRVQWQAQVDWVRQLLRSGEQFDQADLEQLRPLVAEVLKQQYADQLRRQGIELQVVERRLANLRDQLARRAAAAQRVVDFELQRLDLEAGGLGLGSDAQLQLAPTSAGGFGGGGYDEYDSGYDMGGGYGGGGGRRRSPR